MRVAPVPDSPDPSPGIVFTWLTAHIRIAEVEGDESFLEILSKGSWIRKALLTSDEAKELKMSHSFGTPTMTALRFPVYDTTTIQVGRTGTFFVTQ